MIMDLTKACPGLHGALSLLSLVPKGGPITCVQRCAQTWLEFRPVTNTRPTFPLSDVVNWTRTVTGGCAEARLNQTQFVDTSMGHVPQV